MALNNPICCLDRVEFLMVSWRHEGGRWPSQPQLPPALLKLGPLPKPLLPALGLHSSAARGGTSEKATGLGACGAPP